VAVSPEPVSPDRVLVAPAWPRSAVGAVAVGAVAVVAVCTPAAQRLGAEVGVAAGVHRGRDDRLHAGRLHGRRRAGSHRRLRRGLLAGQPGRPGRRRGAAGEGARPERRGRRDRRGQRTRRVSLAGAEAAVQATGLAFPVARGSAPPAWCGSWWSRRRPGRSRAGYQALSARRPGHRGPSSPRRARTADASLLTTLTRTALAIVTALTRTALAMVTALTRAALAATTALTRIALPMVAALTRGPLPCPPP